MATKKITLNELKSLVKQIIKEAEFEDSTWREKETSTNSMPDEEYHKKVEEKMNNTVTTIKLSGAELKGLMYALNRSDAEDIISSRNERNTPVAIGLMTGKNKLKNVLDNIAHNAYNTL